MNKKPPFAELDVGNKPKALLIPHICIIIKKKPAINGQFSDSCCLINRLMKNVD
jgi:hypothetical protein